MQWMEENSVSGDAAEDTHKIRDLKKKMSEDKVEQAFTKECLHQKNERMDNDTKEGNCPKGSVPLAVNPDEQMGKHAKK
jgi:hypothetical protein